MCVYQNWGSFLLSLVSTLCSDCLKRRAVKWAHSLLFCRQGVETFIRPGPQQEREEGLTHTLTHMVQNGKPVQSTTHGVCVWVWAGVCVCVCLCVYNKHQSVASFPPSPLPLHKTGAHSFFECLCAPRTGASNIYGSSKNIQSSGRREEREREREREGSCQYCVQQQKIFRIDTWRCLKRKCFKYCVTSWGERDIFYSSVHFSLDPPPTSTTYHLLKRQLGP